MNCTLYGLYLNRSSKEEERSEKLIGAAAQRNLESISLSKKKLVLQGNPKVGLPINIYCPLCQSTGERFYHKQSCLLEYVTCHFLVSYPGNRARKLTKGQILIDKVKIVAL